MLAILMRRNAAAQLATLTPRDILIQPPLGDASSFDFGIVARVIGVGEAAARARRAQLAALTVSERDMQRYVARRESAAPAAATHRFRAGGPGIRALRSRDRQTCSTIWSASRSIRTRWRAA